MGKWTRAIAGYKTDIAKEQKALKAAVRAGNDSEAERIQDNLHQLRGNLRNVESLPEDD